MHRLVHIAGTMGIQVEVQTGAADVGSLGQVRDIEVKERPGIEAAPTAYAERVAVARAPVGVQAVQGVVNGVGRILGGAVGPPALRDQAGSLGRAWQQGTLSLNGDEKQRGQDQTNE